MKKFLGVALLLLVVACSGTSTGNGSGGNCTNDFSGTWNLSGGCSDSSCTVAQSGCSASVSCNAGTQLSGSLSGGMVSLSGTFGDGTTGTCSGTVAGAAMTITCTNVNGNCTSSGRCTTGACGKAVPSATRDGG